MLLEPSDDIGEAVGVGLGEGDEVAALASCPLKVAEDGRDGPRGVAKALAILDEEEAHSLVGEGEGAQAGAAAEGLEAAEDRFLCGPRRFLESGLLVEAKLEATEAKFLVGDVEVVLVAEGTLASHERGWKE